MSKLILSKKEIEAIPLFPSMEERIEQEPSYKIITFRSKVYVHFDCLSSVMVQTVPVCTTFVIKSAVDIQKAKDHHLKECLIVSKYYILNDDNTNDFPITAVLYKNDADFTLKLHTMYP